MYRHGRLFCCNSVAGFTYWFELHYGGPRCFKSSKYPCLLWHNPAIVNRKLQIDPANKAHRIVRPYIILPFDNLQFSLIGIVPKQ